MTREQTLLAAAIAFQDLVNIPNLLAHGWPKNLSHEYTECLRLAEADLLAARKAYEGVAFETGGT